MKKLILLIVSVTLIFGCGGKSEKEEMDINAALAGYEGVCADISFADARAKMAVVNEHRAASENAEADQANAEAKVLFDQGVADYTDRTKSMDSSRAAITNQKSRMDAIKPDAEKVARKEFNDTQRRVSVAHTSAEKSLDECDVKAAEATLANSEKDVAALEALVASRMGGAAATAGAGEVYVVKKGDSLWKIAAQKYSNPYFWPLIYWSNQDVIKRGPDLIFPNQKFKIEHTYNDQRKAEAERRAKTRGAWSLFDSKF